MNISTQIWKYIQQSGRYEFDLGDKKKLRLLESPDYVCVDFNDLSHSMGYEVSEFIIYEMKTQKITKGVSIITDGFSHNGGNSVRNLLKKKDRFFGIPGLREEQTGLVRKLFEEFEKIKV